MSYSDAEKAEALIRLAINKYNFEKTSKDLGITKMTLRRWNKNVPKKGVADLLERAIERLLMSIPEKMGGQQWSIAIGILMDKWLLTQGKPTSRVDQTVRTLGLSQDELNDVLAEANRILEEAAGSGDTQGNSGAEG